MTPLHVKQICFCHYGCVFDSVLSFSLRQFCFVTCGVFSCLAVVGRYIPGLVLSYSAGESQRQKKQEQVGRETHPDCSHLKMYMVLKPDLWGGPPKQGLDGGVIKGRLILTEKDGKGARQKGGHIDTKLIPSPPNRWRLES